MRVTFEPCLTYGLFMAEHKDFSIVGSYDLGEWYFGIGWDLTNMTFNVKLFCFSATLIVWRAQ